MRTWEILTILAVSGMPTSAAAQEMATIDRFIQQNANATNGSTEVFVGLRCSSLFALMGVYAGNNELNDYADRFSKASKSALRFAANNQIPKDADYLVGQLEIMTQAYKERFLKAKALTGNFSDDPVIAADFKTCSDVF